MKQIEIIPSSRYTLKEFFILMKINPLYREGGVVMVYEPKFEVNPQSVLSGLLLKNHYQRISKVVPFRGKKDPEVEVVRARRLMLKFKQTCGVNHCAYCQVFLEPSEKTVDHFVPLAEGGTNDEDNLRISCDGCNQAKGKINPPKNIQKWEIFLTWSRSDKALSFTKYLNDLSKKKYPKVYL